MTQIIAVAKAGVNVLTATDPNDFIFHSSYNTFKIIASAVVSFTGVVPGLFTKTAAHGLSYTPIVDAFMKADSNAEVIRSGFQQFYTAPYNDVLFYEVQSDATNVIFTGRNFRAVNVDLTFKYYIFEVPL